MRVQCGDCYSIFDDAEKLTFCPHDPIMPADDLEQKKLGLSLIGKPIRFAHEPDGPNRSVQAIGWNGMVTLQGMVGEFAPHLFIFAPVLQDERTLSPEEAIDALVVGDVVTAEAGGSLVTDGERHLPDEPEVLAPTGFHEKNEALERISQAISAGVPLAATICTYVAVDTETNDLPDYDLSADAPSQPWLAQAGMIFLDGDFNELGRFVGYVKPEGWEMKPGASAANGLTTEFLLAHGLPVGEVLDVYEAAIKAGAMVCAQNCQFDAKILRGALRRAGRPDLFEETRQFCTMRAWAAHHKVKWPKLATLCGYFGINHVKAHDAEGDADAVAKLLPLMRDLGIEIEGKVHRSSKPQFKDRKQG